MSSSAQIFEPTSYVPSAFFYRDVAPSPEENLSEHIEVPVAYQAPMPVTVGVPQDEVEQMVGLARIRAIAETEARLHHEMALRTMQEMQKVDGALKAFVEERKTYFAKVESDVVHLSRAIAAKILHREAQVDGMLIAALVRVAINQLHDGSTVTVRVPVGEVAGWTEYLLTPSNAANITVVEDGNLSSDDCVLETEVGSANFGIDAQLKEVERGFFDLLAQRPAIK